MALNWWLTLGGIEVANHTRLAAYLDGEGDADPSPLTHVELEACGCPTFTPELVGDEPYASPAADPAPWYSPHVPESGDFLGLLVLSVEGLEDRPVTRSVTPALTGGAAFGRARVQPRTVTVTALLLASSCCGVDYGLAWLGEALAGCPGGGCDGADLQLASCCPPETPTVDEFEQRYLRTIRRVALVQGPTVTSRVGDGCHSGDDCSGGADLVTVEMVLTAGVPWQWTTPQMLLQVPIPADESDDCIEWCIHGTPLGPSVCVELPEDCPGDGVEFGCGDCPPGTVAWPDDELCPGEEPAPCDRPCRLAACPDPDAACQDPGCRTPTPPEAPPPETCYCAAIAAELACYEVDISNRPGCFTAAPMITVEAGSADLRHVSIAFYRRRSPEHDGLSCDRVAEVERCNPHSVYEIGFVPAGGVLELDGQVGRATVTCFGASETSADTFGRDGAPPSWELLEPGEYCVCITSDALAPPAPDAQVTISISGRGY